MHSTRLPFGGLASAAHLAAGAMVLVFWPASAWGQDAAARLRTGLEALDGQQFDAAADEFRAGLTGVKDNTTAGSLYFYLGLSQQQQAASLPANEADRIKDLRNKAQQSFKKATEVRPESGGSWNNLGLVSKSLSDTKTAAAAFQRAIDLETDDQPAYLVNYADLLHESGREEDAQRFYQAAAERDPANPRAREGLNRHYLATGRPQLLPFVWRLFDEGNLDWAQDMALHGLETSPQGERGTTQLLCCMVRCLSRQNYPPRELPVELQKRLKPLATNPRFAKAIDQLVLLHTADNPRSSQFNWWRAQGMFEGNVPAPRGGWAQEGFTELIRSLGQRCEDRKDVAAAERYYLLAYELTEQHLDPQAVIKLANLWVKTGKRDRLNDFLDREERRIFSEKGEAIQRQNHKRTYELHRALAMIYVHVNRWDSREPYHNAEFQLRAALEDAAKFNAAAAAANRPERIADWQLVDQLAERFERTNRPAEAFSLRVARAGEFQRADKAAEASQVFRPLVGQQPPRGAKEESVRTFQTLKSEFGAEGFKPTVRPGLEDEVRVPLRSPSGQEVRIKIASPANVRRDDLRQVPDLIEKLMKDSAATPAKPKPIRPGNAPVRLLPQTDPAKNVEKVQFDGRAGTVDLKVGGRSVRVPFSIEPAEGQAKPQPFRYIKP